MYLIKSHVRKVDQTNRLTFHHHHHHPFMILSHQHQHVVKPRMSPMLPMSKPRSLNGFRLARNHADPTRMPKYVYVHHLERTHTDVHLPTYRKTF